jgi:NAD(P)H-dependent FMN reductase
MTDPVRILLVSGSLRSGSTNSALVRTARAVAPAGVVATIYDGMGALPHFNPTTMSTASRSHRRRRSCARSSTRPTPSCSRRPSTPVPSPGR